MPNQNTQTLCDRMLAVMADVNAQVAEREELVEAIAIALLTRKNLFILGAPARPRATPSTSSAPASPGPGSLNAYCPSRPTRNSFLGAWICPACFPAPSRSPL